MADKSVRVAVYARVSTQEQAVEGTSLEHQSDQLESYCQSQGWKVIQEYVDAGFTGKDSDRPKLKHLLADAKLGLFNKVVVYKMDRLARNLRLLLEIEDKLKENGISFHSVKEAFDTSTASGRHFLQMLGMISEWEREAIIERTKAGRLQRYKQGCWGAGNPSYGYSYNHHTKKLVIDEEKATIVRKIFNMYTTGKSLSYIANELNKELIPSRNGKGKGWWSSSVRHIIINPIYKGTLLVNRHQNIEHLSRVDIDKVITIKISPIIRETTWELAQQHLKSNKRCQPVRKDKWLLQGLITCGLCGYSFATSYSRQKRIYNCRGRLRAAHIDGSPRCTLPRLNAEELENHVWQRIEAIMNDPNKLEVLLLETINSLKNREAELNARIQPINKCLSEIAEQKTRLADDFVRLNIDANKYKDIQQNLYQEEARLKSIQHEIDPSQIEELESTEGILHLWKKQLNSMAWNTENEDGSMVRLVDEPHKIALKIVSFEDKDVTKIMHFPATRRELLDMFQVRLIVFIDRIEMKAVFSIEPIYQLCHPACRQL